MALKKKRSESICINKILSDKRFTEKFIILHDNLGYSCTKQSFIENQRRIIRAHHYKKNFPSQEENVEAIPLSDLLDECNTPKAIDFLALDIEDSEYKVLKNFQFDKYVFRCISIEGNKCDELLTSKGYKKVKNRYNKRAPLESNFVYEFKS